MNLSPRWRWWMVYRDSSICYWWIHATWSTRVTSLAWVRTSWVRCITFMWLPSPPRWSNCSRILGRTSSSHLRSRRSSCNYGYRSCCSPKWSTWIRVPCWTTWTQVIRSSCGDTTTYTTWWSSNLKSRSCLKSSNCSTWTRSINNSPSATRSIRYIYG